VLNFVWIVYFVALWRRKTQFLPFFGLRHLVVYCSAFMAKLGAQTLTLKSVTDKPTDKQTDKKQNFLDAPAVNEIRA